MRTLLLLLLAAAVAAGAPAQRRVPLGQRIEALLKSSPDARRAAWGVHVVDLASGKTVYTRGADNFFVPASNTKLFSTALALTRLGPDHRYETTVLADAAPDASGTLRGSLVLRGGGDPTLSARAVPYRKGPVEGDPLEPLRNLAAAVAARGVRRVTGGIIGDDSAYVWEPYPEGWGMDDATWEYGAPVSALILNDNAFTLTVRPGARAGDPARVALSPPLEYFEIDNRGGTSAGQERSVRVRRAAGSSEIEVWGKVPLGGSGRSALLAVDDPALFAARAFREALQSEGITVDGPATALHRRAAEVPDLASGEPEAAAQGVVLARRRSPPLIECLAVVNKASQNLHAEVALREVGRVRRHVGSRQAGLEEMKAFLSEVGIPEKDYNFEDGSGLSRLTLITPSAVTRLLSYMHRKHGEAWVKLLPIGGVDGTLSTRFRKAPRGAQVLAKTGTLSHVSALGGYAGPRGGLRYAFSIVVNNYHAPSPAVRGVMDAIALLLAQ